MIHVLDSIFRTWAHHRASLLATIGVLSVAFFLVGLLVQGLWSVRQGVRGWGGEQHILIYLEEGVTNEERALVAQSLNQQKHIRSIEYVNALDALARLRDRWGVYASEDLLSGVDESILSAFFEAQISEDFRASATVDRMNRLIAQIQAVPGVSDVSIGQEWFFKLSRILRDVERGGLALVLFFGLSCLFVVGNSIRLSLSGRIDEIEVLELIGATPSRIRLPFVAEGILIGAIAGVLATSTLGALYFLAGHRLDQALGAVGLAGFSAPPHPLLYLGLMTMGVLSGGLGAYLCVRGMSSGWAAAFRKGH